MAGNIYCPNTKKQTNKEKLSWRLGEFLFYDILTIAYEMLSMPLQRIY